jgi:hypothetical protein
MKRRFGVLLAVWVLAIAGCSASVDVDKAQLKSRPIGCVKGAAVACPCPDGTASQQVCNALGRYDACQCDEPAGAGTGG